MKLVSAYTTMSLSALLHDMRHDKELQVTRQLLCAFLSMLVTVSDVLPYCVTSYSLSVYYPILMTNTKYKFTRLQNKLAVYNQVNCIGGKFLMQLQGSLSTVLSCCTECRMKRHSMTTQHLYNSSSPWANLGWAGENVLTTLHNAGHNTWHIFLSTIWMNLSLER